MKRKRKVGAARNFKFKNSTFKEEVGVAVLSEGWMAGKTTWFCGGGDPRRVRS